MASVAAQSVLQTSGLDPTGVEPQVVGAANNAAGSSIRMRSPQPSPEPERGCEDDDEELNSVTQQVPTAEEHKWSTFLMLTAAADILVSGIMLVVATSFAWKANGVSLYCLAIQAISHLISSVLVAFRFKGELRFKEGSGQEGLLRRQRRTHLVREQILSETMGISMLISATGLLFKAFRKIKFWDEWQKDHKDQDAEAQWAMEFLAWYGFAFYTMQALFRLLSARKLRRSLVWHAFAVSIVSLIFLFILGLAASYEKEWSWKAEPIAAIALAFVTLGEGIRIIILHLDDMDTRLRFDPRA